MQHYGVVTAQYGAGSSHAVRPAKKTAEACRSMPRRGGLHGSMRSGARIGKTHRVSTRQSDMKTAEANTEEQESTASCPFSSLLANTPLGKAMPPAEGQPDVVRTPGPPPLGLDSMMDVSQIVIHGIHVAMLNYFEKYGPVCRFANPVDLNGAAGWLMINDPEDVKHACATNVYNYTERYLPDIYKWVTNEKGILGSQGDYNKRHRRMCQPTFRKPALLDFFSTSIARRSSEAADILAELGAHSETDVALQMQRLTLDVVGDVAFSYDFGQTRQMERELQGRKDQRPDDALLKAVNEFGEVMSEVFVTPMPILKLMDRIGMPQLRTLEQSVDVIRETMLGIVSERRAALAEDPEHHCTNDLLGQLLTAEDDDGNAVTDEELWHDVHDIMGAGHETTATTAAATIYCVSAHPHVEAKVAEELEALGGRAPEYSDLERLPYLSQVVKEVLRMYPPIPLFPRTAAEADVLPSGHRVQAGDVVFMSSYTLGRSPALWDDPLTFDPDRFSPEAEEAQHPYTWLPFGAGPRMCLGAGFAQMSVTLMAAAMLQKIRFVPVAPTSELIEVDYDITMNFNPTRGLKMRIEPREDALYRPREVVMDAAKSVH